MKEWLGHIGTKLLLVLIVFSVAENVLLFFQLRKLKNTQTTQPRQSDPILSVGEVIPALRAMDINGKALNVSFSGKKMIFIYSSACRFCEQNFDNWRKIEESIGVNNIFYLSADTIDRLREYATVHGITDRTLVLSDLQEKIKLKISRIPQTVLIKSGKVEFIHIGVLPSEKIGQLISLWKGESE